MSVSNTCKGYFTRERCGKDRMLSETHSKRGDMLIRDIIARMRHDGCGGRAGELESTHGHRGHQQPADASM